VYLSRASLQDALAFVAPPTRFWYHRRQRADGRNDARIIADELQKPGFFKTSFPVKDYVDLSLIDEASKRLK
jgi:hypothetical protein